jgi:hypothetical protein
MDRSNRESGYRCTEKRINSYNNRQEDNNNNKQQVFGKPC